MDNTAQLDDIIASLKNITDATERSIGAVDLASTLSEIFKSRSVNDESGRRKLEDDVVPSRIVEISPKAAESLGEVVSASLRKHLLPTHEEKKQKDLPTSLIPAGAVAILGGLGALVSGILSNNELSRWLTTVGKVGLVGGFKVITKAMEKTLGIGTAVKALTKFIPKNLFPSISKAMTKMFTKTLGKGGVLLKRIPGIGSLISFALAYKSIKNGQYISGMLDIASGIASIFPGIGTAVGIGIDVLNAMLQMKTAPKENETAFQAETRVLKDMWIKVKDTIVSSYPFKYILDIGEGISMLNAGDIKNGIRFLSNFIPGIGFIEQLIDYNSLKPIKNISEKLVNVGDMFSTLANAIIEKLSDFIGDIGDSVKESVKTFNPAAMGIEAGQTISDKLSDLFVNFYLDKDIQNKSIDALPKRERGGPVKQNQPYIVGEKGPELFTPASDGGISSNKALTKAIDNSVKSLTDAINEGNVPRILSVVVDELRNLNAGLSNLNNGRGATQLASVNARSRMPNFPDQSGIKSQRDLNRPKPSNY